MKVNKEYSGRFVLRLPKFLHSELAREAHRERVSLNQYCVYLLSKYCSPQSFLSTLEKIHEKTAEISPEKIEKTIQEVIKEVREEEKRSKKKRQRGRNFDPFF